MSDYTRLTASEVVTLTRAGKLSVEDYAKSLLARAHARDGKVKAWAFLDPELVLKSARALDAIPAEKRGPLHGVAVGVKDVILTKDMPTQHGSTTYEGNFPKLDAGPVQILRSAGALIFGKTHTTEYAATVKGAPTNNPHDLSRTPGGSSAGSGAAVADFHVPISLGTQTGGSIVRPGSFNGVLGFKPTWGAITREGLKIYSISCDTLGVYSRSVEDLVLVSDIFRVVDDVPPEPTPLDLKSARFAFCKTPMWENAQEGTVAAYTKGMELLKEAGAEVEEIELPEAFAPISQKWHGWVNAGEGRSAFLPDFIDYEPHLPALITDHVKNTKGITRADLLEAYDGIARLRPVIDDIAGRYTALVVPSVTGEAPIMEEPLRFTGDAIFCSMWTVLHTPVINIPGFKGENGLPVGLSLVAPRYHDQSLLRVAQAVTPVFARGGFESAL